MSDPLPSKEETLYACSCAEVYGSHPPDCPARQQFERLTREKAHHLEARLNAGKAMQEAIDAAAVAEERCDRLRAKLKFQDVALRLIKAGPPLRMANDAVASWAAFIASEAISGEPEQPNETESRHGSPTEIAGVAVKDGRAVVYGSPATYPEDTALHNCDEMGCGLTHVLWRGAIDKDSAEKANRDGATPVRASTAEVVLPKTAEPTASPVQPDDDTCTTCEGTGWDNMRQRPCDCVSSSPNGEA